MLKCRAIEDQVGLLNKQLEASENYKSQYLKQYKDAISDKNKLSDDYSSCITKLQSTCSLLEERSSSLLKTLESTNAAEARLAAAKEQAQSAQEEAEDWKRKYDIAVREAKAALEKAAIAQERTNKDTQKREDALRAEFSIELVAKEEEVKEKVAKIEYAEQCLITIKSELKAAESKIENYAVEIMSLKNEISVLSEKFETANAKAQSFEREARIVEQEKIHIEQKYLSEFRRFEEVQERCRNAEKEAQRSTEMADKARGDAVLDSLLDTERKARAEPNSRAEDLSVKLKSAQAKIDSLQQKLTTVLINETAVESKLKTASLGKWLRADYGEIGKESVQDMDIGKASRGNKRMQSTTSPLKHIHPEDGGSVYRGNKDNHSNKSSQEDYTKFTMLKLRQELMSHNFGAELLQLKNPSKKDLLALYQKLVLQKL
ncbi:hypothetical protein NL676_012843 [Syzygium grande]|nr:hypothetical protein NL676_012843 [Syzygium grande]